MPLELDAQTADRISLVLADRMTVSTLIGIAKDVATDGLLLQAEAFACQALKGIMSILDHAQHAAQGRDLSRAESLLELVQRLFDEIAGLEPDPSGGLLRESSLRHLQEWAGGGL